MLYLCSRPHNSLGCSCLHQIRQPLIALSDLDAPKSRRNSHFKARHAYFIGVVVPCCFSFSALQLIFHIRQNQELLNDQPGTSIPSVVKGVAIRGTINIHWLRFCFFKHLIFLKPVDLLWLRGCVAARTVVVSRHPSHTLHSGTPCLHCNNNVFDH